VGVDAELDVFPVEAVLAVDVLELTDVVDIEKLSGLWFYRLGTD